MTLRLYDSSDAGDEFLRLVRSEVVKDVPAKDGMKKGRLVVQGFQGYRRRFLFFALQRYRWRRRGFEGSYLIIRVDLKTSLDQPLNIGTAQATQI